MKPKYFLTLIACLSILVTTSCAPNRELADKDLVKACVAAVKIMTRANSVDINVTRQTFRSEEGPGNEQLRIVTIDTEYVENGGFIDEKSFTCAFDEIVSWKGYNPKFFHMEAHGRKYGNFEGKIKGELNDLMKINEAVEGILR